ncbi:MAG: RluA family pseudouridine synthase [Clostridia bacterium]
MSKTSIVISKEQDGLTIKQLFGSLSYSNNHIRRLKYSGSICVNGQKSTVRSILRVGDKVELTVNENADITPLNFDIKVIYDDEYLYAVYKPSGVPTHPKNFNTYPTLAHFIKARYDPNNNGFPIHIATRLDKDTSGIVLGAKDDVTKSLLSTMLSLRQIEKTYCALCKGFFAEQSGTIIAPILRADIRLPFRIVSQDGKYAETHFQVLCQYAEYALVQLRPITGRTHQLRVHMKHIGHPILFDTLYGDASDEQGQLALQCVGLSFVHPRFNTPLTISIPTTL